MNSRSKHNLSLSRLVFILAMVIISGLFITGCGQDVIYEKSYSFADDVWMQDDKPSFEVAITDTVNPVNFLINIRHNNDYPYSNLYLFIDTKYPDGNDTRDTIEFVVARPDGEWLGKGFGKLKSLNVLLQPHLVFPRSGIYTFTFEQAMRVEELEGIEDFGITLEKMQDNK